MKIRSITSHRLRVPIGDKAFYSSQAAFPERNSCLVRIETDDGLVGWGEGGQYGPGEPVAACVDAVLAPRLIGRDPTEPVRIWEELYAFSRDFGQRGTYIEAISAIDIALWDLSGQAAGLPVWKMLGGRFRDRVTAYATGCYYPENFRDQPAVLSALEQEVSGYKDTGFGLLKVKIGLLSLEQDLERLRVIRETVGPAIGLMVDANHAYNAGTAVRMGFMMEPYDVRFFEEPVPPEDRDGYRKVRTENPIPVAGGCVDIVQPDISACGGFTAFTHVLALANAYGVATIPHVWGSGVAVATALHGVAVVPPFPHTANPLPLLNEPVIEFDRTPNPLRDDLLEDRFALEHGALKVPDRPGLGVTVREEVLAKYSS